MSKKSIIALLMVLCILLLASCSKVPNEAIENGNLNIETYLSTLSDKKVKHLKPQANLLNHPLKDAITLCGDDYEISWEGVYVTLSFKEAKCSFRAYVGTEFESYDWYNNYVDMNNYNVMEYISLLPIERVIFDGDGLTLTDGISVGMTVSDITEELNVDGIDYYESSATITTEYDKEGNRIDVYTISGKVSDTECFVTFSDDVLSGVELVISSRYLTNEKSDSDHGKQAITKAFSYLSKNQLASFNSEHLSYRGKIYSPFYDSWFDNWYFTNGDYKDYEINVEQTEPNRIYVAANADTMPILFWSDGKYVDPMLSFLGKWRDYDTNKYIDIKSISKEGIVVFDFYTNVNDSDEMILLKNLSTAINEPVKSLKDFIFNEYADEFFNGDMQIYNGTVQSGYYGYAGDKIYLVDSLSLDPNGSVSYIPRSPTGRIGSGNLTIHIPDKDTKYTQKSTWGYMENFGRDDPNSDNTVKSKSPDGDSVINDYLNIKYETNGLKYAEMDYKYLHDYLFTVNNITYNVWESKDVEDPHYLYVDKSNQMLIKECKINSISKHTKELIYKDGTSVSGKSYAAQKYSTPDGKITVDLINRTINNANAFVETIDISDIGFDKVGINERFMLFADIGNRFALNGYVLFDHTTWGATLHITDSNVPDFDIGVYYLNSETFFLDPSIGVVSIPKDSNDNKYIDEKIEENTQETKLVIRQADGRIIGYIYVDNNGKKTVKDYGGKIIGYYHPDRDVTTDFGGKILYRGDAASSLLFSQ